MRLPSRVEQATARLMQMYGQAVAATGSCTCVDTQRRALTAHEITAAAQRTGDDAAHTLFVYWIRDAMTVAMLPYADPGFRDLLRFVRLIADDTFGGRVSGYFMQRLGGQYSMLALPGDPARLTQLRAIMAERTSWILAVDGGGPYGRIGTGLIALAASVGARIVPLSAQASRVLIVSPQSKVRFPLFGCRLVVAMGEPIVVSRETDRRRAAEMVRGALESLRGIAWQVLRSV